MPGESTAGKPYAIGHKESELVIAYVVDDNNSKVRATMAPM